MESDLGFESRAVHRKHIRRRRPQLVCEEVYGGLYALVQVRRAEMQAAYDLRRT